MSINLIHGDCLEEMKNIPSGSVDMVLTDPPYGTTACKWDSIIPLEPMWEQLKRIIKLNGAIVMTASQPFTSVLIASNLKQYKHNWIWDQVRVVKKDGSYIDLRELLAGDDFYTSKEIRSEHNLLKMLLAGAFNFKDKI